VDVAAEVMNKTLKSPKPNDVFDFGLAIGSTTDARRATSSRIGRSLRNAAEDSPRRSHEMTMEGTTTTDME